jgi:hypothetical protein
MEFLFIITIDDTIGGAGRLCWITTRMLARIRRHDWMAGGWSVDIQWPEQNRGGLRFVDCLGITMRFHESASAPWTMDGRAVAR